MHEALTLAKPETAYLPIPNLSQEVSLIRQNGIRESGPWYLLPGTGFNVRLQMDEFEQDLKTGISEGKTPLQILEEAFSKIEQNIQAFKIEYLSRGLLFPIVLDKQISGGRERIVAPLYNNKRLVDTVSSQERGGAVKQSLIKVEEFLLTAKPGSIAILTSPDGWSGYESITYQDTQTYIWQVQEDGKPRGFTVRTDMLLLQNQQLLKSLGKDLDDTKSQKDQIVDMVANPIFYRYNQGQQKWDIKDVVDIIKYIKNSEFAYENRRFSEIYESLKDPQRLWTLDQITQMLTDQLKTYLLAQVENGEYSRQNAEIALGTTVLKLAQKIRGVRQTNSLYSQPQLHTNRNPQIMNYQAALEDVQTLPGCAGGGSRKTSIFNSISPRLVFSSLLTTEDEGVVDFQCPGTKKDGTKCTHIVRAYSHETKCPECGEEATCA